MSLARRLGRERWWGPIAALAMVLTFLTTAFLLLRALTAPVGPTPSAAPSHEATARPLPSDPEVSQARADQGPGAPAAPDPTPDESATDMPSPAEGAPPRSSEQRVFRSRKALETIDPRELLRHANTPSVAHGQAE